MNQMKTTIAAICTPPGDGGVAMIRISGLNALEVAQKIFSKDLSTIVSHQLIYGKFINDEKKEIDHGLLVIMKAPNSYTGEDVVELFCHGGRLITKKVLQIVIDAGAIIANPGEFTQRAYLNQKMDLAQAEAVQSLISAQNDYALKIAKQQLEGKLSLKIKQLQANLIDQAAILEAWVDFPEEGIEFCSLDEIIHHLERIESELSQLIASYHDGQSLVEGFSLCLLGSPNVGKSSLMNALLKKERAIVTPIAGTTRDLLEETLLIQGMQFRLVDTAGIRQVDEIIEKEGIERALKRANEVDLILLVLDASQRLSDADRKLINQVQDKKVLVIWNKSDIASLQKEGIPFENQIEVSAKTGLGIDVLCQKMVDLTLCVNPSLDQIYLTELRHKNALEEASGYLKEVIVGLKEQKSPEWLSFDLKSSLKSLSSVIGFDITENILSSIFSKFCIGK